MRLARIFLLAAGILSLCAAALHFAIFLVPQWSSIFGDSNPPDQTAFRAVTLGVTSLLLIWGVYGLSGAGLIRSLPLLRLGILLIGAVYVSYGLLAMARLLALVDFLPPSRTPQFQDLFVVLAALIAGIFYLAGLLLGWKGIGRMSASA